MASLDKYKGKRFTKSPLAEVVVEIRYPVNLSIDCRKDEFYKIIRNEFPVVQLPDPISMEPHLSQPISFISLDGKKNLKAGATRFAFLTRTYLDYKNFEQEIIPLLSSFTNLYEISNVEKLGLRYINHIETSRSQRGVDYQNILEVQFVLPTSVHKNSLSNFRCAFVANINDGNIRTTIGTGQTNSEGQPKKDILVLDNDVSIIGNIPSNTLPKVLSRAHDEVETIFIEILKDTYLDSLGLENA